VRYSTGFSGCHMQGLFELRYHPMGRSSIETGVEQGCRYLVGKSVDSSKYEGTACKFCRLQGCEDGSPGLWNLQNLHAVPP